MSYKSHSQKHSLAHIIVFCACLIMSLSFAKEAKAEMQDPLLSGFIDTGFSLAIPTGTTQTARAAWSLNEIEIQLQHKWSSFFKARVAINYLPSTTSQVDLLWLMDQLLQEAWFEFKAGIGAGWEAYALMGRYFATMGWDAVNTVDRFQATGSFGQQITPNTFVGGKIGVRNSFFDAHFQLVNGWDTLTNPDTTIGFGGSVSLNTRFFRANLAYTSARGDALAPRFAASRLHLVDLHVTIPLWGERILLGGEGFVGISDGIAANDGLLYGAVACFHIMPVSFLGLTVRYSRFGDNKLSGLTNVLREEVSIALLSMLTSGLRLITEYRLDLVDGQLQSHLWIFKGIYSF